MTLRLNGSTSGYSDIDAPAIAGNQVFTLPTTGGTLDRINRAGNILQVVNATYSTTTSASSSTFADTGLTATITPTSSSSKILVLVSQGGVLKSTSDTSVRLRLLRGATQITLFEDGAAYTANSIVINIGTCSTCYLDSPATTSATTYKTQLASNSNTAIVYAQGGTGTTSTITLIEVAA
jgi:Ni,Fe-hydrogenase I small subunit